MGLWSILTGASKTADVIDAGLDLVKQGAKGLDALVYTEEEKAVNQAKNTTDNMGHVLDLAKLSQTESGASAVTRRVFGMIILGNFTLVLLATLIAACIGKTELVNTILAVANALSVGYLAITVVVSTFGYYTVTKGLQTITQQK